jgi:hypothetical protein
MHPDKHPSACRVCGAEIPPRDEPRGRPRLFCNDRCRERNRSLVELARYADVWEGMRRADYAARLRDRAEAKRAAWKAS